MQNQAWASATLLFSSVCIYRSWKLQQREQYRLAIFLLMLAGFALRFFTSLDFFLHPWDEAYHALVAKHLLSHPLLPTLYENPVLPYDPANWAGNHIWLHKPPLPLWAMAFSMYLFGVNEIALRLPSVLLTTVGIWLTFKIGSYIFDRRTALLAAFFYAVNGLIIEMAAGRVPTDHIDVFFLFFIELSIFFAVQFCRSGKAIFNILCGVGMGAAILSKWLPALIVMPVWALLVLDTRRYTFKQIAAYGMLIGTTALMVVAPWQWYIFHRFPVEAFLSSSQHFKHISEVLDHQGGPIYYYLDKIRINYGELIYLPIIWFSWRSMKGKVSVSEFSLIIWAFVPILFFSMLKTKMQGYILFVAPALFLISAAFFSYVIQIQLKNKYPRLISLLLIGFIILPIRYTIERIKPFDLTSREKSHYSGIKSYKTKDSKGLILLNCQRPIDAMFYNNGVTAYSFLPDTGIIKDLTAKGYTILVNDKVDLPNNIRQMEGVTIVHEDEQVR